MLDNYVKRAIIYSPILNKVWESGNFKKRNSQSNGLKIPIGQTYKSRINKLYGS